MRTQIYLQDALVTKTDWVTDVQRDEAKQNRASQEDNVQCGKGNLIQFLVAMRLGETPVHIPNTMVKT